MSKKQISIFVLSIVMLVVALGSAAFLFITYNAERTSQTPRQALFSQSVQIPAGVKAIAAISQFTGGTFQYGPPEDTSPAMSSAMTRMLNAQNKLFEIRKNDAKYRRTVAFDIAPPNQSTHENTISDIHFYLNTISGTSSVYVIDPDGIPLSTDYQDIEIEGTGMSQIASVYNPKPGKWEVTVVAQGTFTFEIAANEQ